MDNTGTNTYDLFRRWNAPGLRAALPTEQIGAGVPVSPDDAFSALFSRGLNSVVNNPTAQAVGRSAAEGASWLGDKASAVLNNPNIQNILDAADQAQQFGPEGLPVAAAGKAGRFGLEMLAAAPVFSARLIKLLEHPEWGAKAMEAMSLSDGGRLGESLRFYNIVNGVLRRAGDDASSQVAALRQYLPKLAQKYDKRGKDGMKGAVSFGEQVGEKGRTAEEQIEVLAGKQDISDFSRPAWATEEAAPAAAPAVPQPAAPQRRNLAIPVPQRVIAPQTSVPAVHPPTPAIRSRSGEEQAIVTAMSKDPISQVYYDNANAFTKINKTRERNDVKAAVNLRFPESASKIERNLGIKELAEKMDIGESTVRKILEDPSGHMQNTLSMPITQRLQRTKTYMAKRPALMDSVQAAAREIAPDKADQFMAWAYRGYPRKHAKVGIGEQELENLSFAILNRAKELKGGK